VLRELIDITEEISGEGL